MSSSNETIYNLMLDALRRGILMTQGCKIQNNPSELSLIEQKKRICQSVNQLQYDQKLQICLAIARISGFESLGRHNNGCFVDITNWNADQLKKLSDVIQFASK